jgi:hypothetical protein
MPPAWKIRRWRRASTTNFAILTEPQKARVRRDRSCSPGSSSCSGNAGCDGDGDRRDGQSPANIIILSLTVVSVSFVGLGAYRILSPLVSDQPEAP